MTGGGGGNRAIFASIGGEVRIDGRSGVTIGGTTGAPMTLLLLVLSIAFAEPSAEPASPAAEAAEATPDPDALPVRSGPVRGTVARPIEGRAALVEADRDKGDVARRIDTAWQKLTRSLLDFQDALVRQLDAAVASFRLEPGQKTQVGFPNGVKVEIDVMRRDEQRVAVRLRVIDGQGRPVDDAVAAWLSRGRDAEADRLEFAGAGELVIEDLEVADDAMVRILLGDGDVVVVWLDEGT